MDQLSQTDQLVLGLVILGPGGLILGFLIALGVMVYLMWRYPEPVDPEPIKVGEGYNAGVDG